jgi:hypothetical protein
MKIFTGISRKSSVALAGQDNNRLKLFKLENNYNSRKCGGAWATAHVPAVKNSAWHPCVPTGRPRSAAQKRCHRLTAEKAAGLGLQPKPRRHKTASDTFSGTVTGFLTWYFD